MKFLLDNDQMTVEEMYKTYQINNDENIVICAALNYGARMAIPLKGNENKPFNQAAKEIHANLIQQGKISEENFVHHYECISIKCCINNENTTPSTKEAKEDETFANMMRATRKRKIVEKLEKYLDQSTQPVASATNNSARLFKFRERENKTEVEAKKSLINAHLDVMNEIKATIRKR